MVRHSTVIGQISGQVMRQNIWQRVAPSRLAASYSS